MSTPTLHQSLQKKIGAFSGEHLPTTINYLDRYGNTVEKPLLDATLDEVAFSIQTLGTEISAIHRRRSSLESLYNLSREHGCLGLNTVGEIALEVTK
jgi:hypothetical protein